MLRFKWITLALVLALAMVVPAGVAYAAPAPATPAGTGVTVSALFDWVVEWTLGWWGGTKEGMMIDPNGDNSTLSPGSPSGGDKAGPMIDPNGGSGEATAVGGVCGDEGPMIDPNGGRCSP